LFTLPAIRHSPLEKSLGWRMRKFSADARILQTVRHRLDLDPIRSHPHGPDDPSVIHI
jgi:hypothetical protein